MPNHIHLIWKVNSYTGKELPSASLLKYTAHKFQDALTEDQLTKFRILAPNKKFEFWKRDSLAFELYTPAVAYQKLDYIHNNPVSKKWCLVEDPVDYYYSSYSFYERGDLRFPFLSHLGEEL